MELKKSAEEENEENEENKRIDNVKKLILKKSNIGSLILNLVVDILIVLFVCSLFFAWGPVLKYIFLFAFLALIAYKGFKQYWRERRKYFAVKASKCLQKQELSHKKKLFFQEESIMPKQKEKLLSQTNGTEEALRINIKKP